MYAPGQKVAMQIPWGNIMKQILKSITDRLIYIVIVFALVIKFNNNIGYQTRKTGTVSIKKRSDYIPFMKVLKTNFLLQE